jgi:hypothetical protein
MAAPGPPLLLLHGQSAIPLNVEPDRPRTGQALDAPAIRRQYCTEEVIGGAVDCGHYIAEKAPDATLEWFNRFF